MWWFCGIVKYPKQLIKKKINTQFWKTVPIFLQRKKKWTIATSEITHNPQYNAVIWTPRAFLDKWDAQILKKGTEFSTKSLIFLCINWYESFIYFLILAFTDWDQNFRQNEKTRTLLSLWDWQWVFLFPFIISIVVF